MKASSDTRCCVNCETLDIGHPCAHPDCPCHKPECNCATARGIEWTCPVHGRMWREKEVAAWETRFEKFDYFFKLMDLKSPGDGTLGQEQIKSFIAKEIEAAEARGRNGAVDYIVRELNSKEIDSSSVESVEEGVRFLTNHLRQVFKAARQIPGV